MATPDMFCAFRAGIAAAGAIDAATSKFYNCAVAKDGAVDGKYNVTYPASVNIAKGEGVILLTVEDTSALGVGVAQSAKVVAHDSASFSAQAVEAAGAAVNPASGGAMNCLVVRLASI